MVHDLEARFGRIPVDAGDGAEPDVFLLRLQDLADGHDMLGGNG